jgi:hypothetical protein
MSGVQITSLSIGLLLAATIIYLLRRDHLHGPYAVWWLSVAVVTGLLGAFPIVIDSIANWLNIGYPPVLALVLAIALLLVKMLTMDIERTRQELNLRRLAQRLAMLDEELKRLQSKE